MNLFGIESGGLLTDSSAAPGFAGQSGGGYLPCAYRYGHGRRAPFDKTDPKAVADSIAQALTSGIEDVFPDLMAQQLFAGWKQDAKALEAQVAAPQG